MADLTISIRVSLPGIIDDSREETVTVPPDYAEQDIRYFVAHAVENIGPRLLRENDFPTPNQEAFFANVARLGSRGRTDRHVPTKRVGPDASAG